MRSECFTRLVIDEVGEGPKFVLQVQLQVTGPSARKPANHPNRKGVITATSATRLALRGPWRLGEPTNMRTHRFRRLQM